MMGHLIIYWRYVRNGGGKSNFKVVTTKNQGLSQARNEGLERAKGEYVYFMDPDDYINPGMFG